MPPSQFSIVRLGMPRRSENCCCVRPAEVRRARMSLIGILRGKRRVVPNDAAIYPLAVIVEVILFDVILGEQSAVQTVSLKILDGATITAGGESGVGFFCGRKFGEHFRLDIVAGGVQSGQGVLVAARNLYAGLAKLEFFHMRVPFWPEADQTNLSLQI